jgi:hypothetical protein
MPEQRDVRPWVASVARPVEVDLVKPVFDAETRLLGRLFARGGREGFEARARRPAAAVGDEEEG